MPKIYPKLLLTISILLVFFSLNLKVFAQATSADIANIYQIQDPNAVDGDILVNNTAQGIVRSSTSYDPNLFGIYQKTPLLVLQQNGANGIPIVRNGTAEVNVIDTNGSIKAGDYITSSSFPGKGQKAISSGYVVGVALANFSLADSQVVSLVPAGGGKPQQVHIGKIPIAIHIEYAELTGSRSLAHLIDAFIIALTQTQDPQRALQIIKYIISGFTILISISAAFFVFSKAIPRGIEAMGRNPLAEKAILSSIILNILFTIITIAFGVLAALIIIKV